MKPLDPSQLREKAAECDRIARAADTDDRRKHWLYMAERWRELAEDVERMQDRGDNKTKGGSEWIG